MRAWPLLFALSLAGCVAPPGLDEAGATDVAPDAGDVSPPLGLAGTGCLEGGGHSVHPRMLNPLPEPWVPADIFGDVGPQLLYSEIPDPMRPIPEEGNTIGNYHATMWCESWTLDGEPRDDLFLGFVGMKVERPEWSDDLPTHHYLVTVVATDDDEVLARLREGGIAALKATAAREELGGGWLRIQMWTEGNGDYDSLFRPQPFGEMRATHVRLWFQQGAEGHAEHGRGASAEGGGYRPVALDLVSMGGEHLVEGAQGYFSHSGTDHHAPLPGAYGHTAALLYRGFDRAVEWGPRPDVTLPDAYVH